MKTTFMDTEKTRLIKKFHTLLGKAGIDNDGKLTILFQYNVSTSKDLTAYELLEICKNLDEKVKPQLTETDKLRKRLIASIGGYFKSMGMYDKGIDDIKSVACRAAKIKSFNSIPKNRLISLYNAFNNRSKDLESVLEITEDQLKRISTLN